MIIARTHKIITIYCIDIQYFSIMPVICLNDPPLGRLPLLHGQIRPHRAQIIGVHPKLNPINRIAMPLQRINNASASYIPQFDHPILTRSSYHLMDEMITHAEYGSLMIVLLLAEGDEIFLARLAIPVDDAAVLGYGEDVGGGQLEAGYASGVALVANGLV